MLVEFLFKKIKNIVGQLLVSADVYALTCE